eukprot:2755147-Amphidinium_carterae.1
MITWTDDNLKWQTVPDVRANWTNLATDTGTLMWNGPASHTKRLYVKEQVEHFAMGIVNRWGKLLRKVRRGSSALSTHTRHLSNH